MNERRGADDVRGALSRREFVKRGTAAAGIIALGGGFAACGGDDDESEPAGTGGGDGEASTVVNWLSWAGDADASFLEPFQQQHGIKVNVQEYDSGEQGAVLIGQSPGKFDVVTIGGEYTGQFVEGGLLQELNPSDYPEFGNFFPVFKEEFGQGTWQDDKMYSMVFKWGNLGVTYRTDKLTEADVSSLDIMTDEKVKGRLGWGTHWANAMGELSIWAGNETPFQISDDAFEELREATLSLGPQTRGFYSITDIFAAFANGEVWLNPGGGDWAALLLAADGQPIAAALPREGHTVWDVTLGVVKDTPRLDAAQKFISYAISPEGQMRTALLPSYQSNVPNQAAWELMQQEEPEWAEKLNMDDIEGDNALTPLLEGTGKIRQLPMEQPVEDWVALWDEFRASL